MTKESDEQNERHRDTARSDRADRIVQLDLALEELAAVNPELASTLAGLTAAVASEALRNRRLAKALSEACSPVTFVDSGSARSGHGVRRPRRNAGPWDPFAVYSEHGEEVLRERLAVLDLEQLRDIVAEHGMDTDRLAMKWRDPNRVVNRIVERVTDRATKGDAFRSPHGQ